MDLAVVLGVLTRPCAVAGGVLVTALLATAVGTVGAVWWLRAGVAAELDRATAAAVATLEASLADTGRRIDAGAALIGADLRAGSAALERQVEELLRFRPPRRLQGRSAVSPPPGG